MTKRERCCGRFMYWRVPYGPWCCSVCERQHQGPLPRVHFDRFAEAIAELHGGRSIDEIVAQLEAEEAAMTPEDHWRRAAMLRLFGFRVRGRV